jgi:3-oxoadipate enol-lactonase
MSVLMRPWGHLHYRVRGPVGALPVLFLNSLGTDLRMWEAVIDRLPDLHCIGMDKRGHGLSATPAVGWTMQDLAEDALALMDHLGLARVMVAGCSIGGIIAQQMGVMSPDRVAGLFLSNTAPKVGTADSWAARVAAVQTQGIAAIAPQILERWFAPAFRASPACLPWEVMLRRADPAGYIGTCQVLAKVDLTADLGRITAPVLMLAGSADLSTPTDLVRATAARIAGARVVELEGSGHIPAIDAPEAVAALLAEFHGGLA